MFDSTEAFAKLQVAIGPKLNFSKSCNLLKVRSFLRLEILLSVLKSTLKDETVTNLIGKLPLLFLADKET